MGKLTGGLAGMARRARSPSFRDSVILDPHHLDVTPRNGGERKVVKFDKAIIAAGSQSIKLPLTPDLLWCVVDSTGARRAAAGAEIHAGHRRWHHWARNGDCVLTLGTQIDVVEMLDGLMTGADRDLVKVWEKKNSDRFRKVMLRTRTVSAEATPDGIRVSFEGENVPGQVQVYDMVLVAVGRSPNGKAI